MKNYQEPLVIIFGPTASGKTSLSLKLAQYIDSEIISADSMQIYQDMDIGTDKVNEESRKEVPHHLIDIITPEEDFSVAEYKMLAREKISNIISRDKLPILVGGTGLYIKAVIENYLLPDIADNNIREQFYQYANKWGRKRLYKHLVNIDPEYAARIHYNDLKRVSRALEIYYSTGKTRTFYEYLQKKMPVRYNHLKIGIWRDREKLYSRINQRVEEMFKEGLIKEVKILLDKYEPGRTASQALGYKELFEYFAGEIKKEKAKKLIKKRTRNLAKKQISFFKRDKDIIWINPDYWNTDELAIKLSGIISDKLKLNFQDFSQGEAGI